MARPPGRHIGVTHGQQANLLEPVRAADVLAEPASLTSQLLHASGTPWIAVKEVDGLSEQIGAHQS